MAYRDKRKYDRPNAAQVTLIHTLAHKMGWSDNYYHDELANRYHVTSCLNLTQRQTRAFIDYLKAEFEKKFGPAPKAPEDDKKPAQAEATPYRLTQRQINLAHRIWDEVSRGRTPQEKAFTLRVFVKRQTGCDDLRFVPREKGEALVCALQEMRKQKYEKEAANNG